MAPLSQLDLNGTYTYADYLTWRLEESVGLIKSKIMAMTTPTPSRKHKGGLNLSFSLGTYFKQLAGNLYDGLFDIVLYDLRASLLQDREVFSVVQPDQCVTCDKVKKLTKQGYDDPPHWNIEILSLCNNQKILRLKFQLYQDSAVTEYSIVHSYEQTVYQLMLNQQEKYLLHAMHPADEIATPYLFPDLQIDLNEVFAK